MKPGPSLFSEAARKKIARLKGELRKQRICRKLIEEKIIEIRSFRAPIARLPRELLLQVFSWVALDNPLKLGTLLLVCKYWKEIARNSPTLWANFSLKMKPDITAIARQTGFVESALSFSQGVPLDIQLHLPQVWELWDHLASKIWTSEPEPYDEEYDEYRDNIEEWLANAHIYEGDPLVLYVDVDIAISNHMETLTGEDGCNLHRLRSLRILFNSTDFTRWTARNLFHYNMPMLEQLIVHTYDDNGVNPPDIFCFPAQQLARIASNFDLMSNGLLTTEGQLTHISIAMDESSCDRFPESRFTRNLTHLYINIQQGWVSKQPELDFDFPVLKDLAIEGLVTLRFINAPQLTSLRLCDKTTRDEFLSKSPVYPRLTRLHLSAGEIDVEKEAIPYVLGLPRLVEVGFLAFTENRLAEILKQVADCAVLNDLVVKGYIYSGYSFMRGFNVYDRAPVIEIKL